jgi:NAD(P)-dependent dehydrogenase (short-subunit alcohol dehydrogenase family)
MQPIMEKNSSIVNVASIYGVVAPDPRIYLDDKSQYNSSIYGMTKAAIIQMSKYYAIQFAPYGIRVNTISPGGIKQEQTITFQKAYIEKTPMRRMAESNEIVDAILFLLSDMSSYITGHNLIVDGGMSAW